MVLRSPDNGPIGAPDGSTPIVGSEGLEVLQESDQLVVKTGVEGDQRDYDIETENITDDEVTLADPDDIGTTAELSGGLKSDEDEPFILRVEWLNDDESSVLFTQEFGSDTEFIIESITIKSDHARVVVEDDSGDGVNNVVTGTLNFH